MNEWFYIYYTSGKSGLREKMNIVVHFAVPGKAIWAANSLCIAVPVKNPNCNASNMKFYTCRLWFKYELLTIIIKFMELV